MTFAVLGMTGRRFLLGRSGTAGTRNGGLSTKVEQETLPSELSRRRSNQGRGSTLTPLLG